MNPGYAWRRPGEGDGALSGVACEQYLDRHSEYLDGELRAEERLAHEAHEAACPACARYARVLRRGSSVLRDLPPVLPTSDFQQRLQHRLYHVRDEAVLVPRRVVGVGRLAAAAVFLVVAGGSLLLGTWPEMPPASGPGTGAGAAPSGQLADSWTPPATPRALLAPPVLPAFTGYSPVVVKPPLYQPVSYELLAGE